MHKRLLLKGEIPRRRRYLKTKELSQQSLQSIIECCFKQLPWLSSLFNQASNCLQSIGLHWFLYILDLLLYVEIDDLQYDLTYSIKYFVKQIKCDHSHFSIRNHGCVVKPKEETGCDNTPTYTITNDMACSLFTERLTRKKIRHLLDQNGAS